MSTKMDYDVLVVGAGPVGLMLATELQLAGIRVVVVERRTELDTAIKAGAINTAAASAFERRGLLPALEAVEGQQGERRRPPFVGHFGGIQVPADAVDEEDPSLRGDAYSRALRGVVTDFLGTRDGATYYVKRISGLWQRYDLGNGHPLVGATMPTLRLDDGASDSAGLEAALTRWLGDDTGRSN